MPTLPRSQVRLVQSLLTGFESAARSAGWDPEAVRSEQAKAVAALYGYPADSPQEPPVGPTPSGNPPGPQGDASAPDPGNVAPVAELPLSPPGPEAPDLDVLGARVRPKVVTERMAGEQASTGQRGKVHAILGGWGITARDERLAALTQVFGHPFTSSSELTRGEAHALIEAVILGATKDVP